MSKSSTRQRPRSQFLKRFAATFVCLTLINICFLMVRDPIIGGSAGLGKIENGKYYVGSHGRYTEVTRNVYLFSRWHEASALIMFIASAFIVLDMQFSKRKWGISKE